MCCPPAPRQRDARQWFSMRAGKLQGFPRAAILLMTSRAHLPDGIKGLPLELSFLCLQQDQCLPCRVCCSCGSIVSVTCYTSCTLQKKISVPRGGKKKGGIFRNVLHIPELGWAITTVSTALLIMSLLQNFGGSRLLPVCRFDRALLLCVPVLPQHCHPCFGTGKWWWELLGWPQMAP